MMAARRSYPTADALWSTKTGKVVFLEGDSDFADFLSHVLRQPLWTLARFQSEVQATADDLQDRREANDDGMSSGVLQVDQPEYSPVVHLYESMVNNTKPSQLAQAQCATGNHGNHGKQAKLVFGELPAASRCVSSPPKMTWQELAPAIHGNYSNDLNMRLNWRSKTGGVQSVVNAQGSHATGRDVLNAVNDVLAVGLEPTLENVFVTSLSPRLKGQDLHGAVLVPTGYSWGGPSGSFSAIINIAARKLEQHLQENGNARILPFTGPSPGTNLRPHLEKTFRDDLQFFFTPQLTMLQSSFVNTVRLLAAAKVEPTDLRGTTIVFEPPMTAKLLANMLTAGCEDVFDGLLDPEVLKSSRCTTPASVNSDDFVIS